LNRQTLTRLAEESAADLFLTIPECTGNPRQVMTEMMQFFVGVSRKFLGEAQRLESVGNMTGALEAWHRSERASAVALEAAKAVSPYVHARLSEAHDQAPAEIAIRGGLRAADAPVDELPLFKLSTTPQVVAPPPAPSDKPVIDLEAQPIESGTSGPKRWKIDL
jgi:hypothetical protein